MTQVELKKQISEQIKLLNWLLNKPGMDENHLSTTLEKLKALTQILAG